MTRALTAADLAFDRADRMRKSLRIADLSVGEMAEYLGVHRNTVTAWINGRNKPDVAAMKLWAMRTSVPYRWLQDGIVPPDGPLAQLAELRTFNPKTNTSSRTCVVPHTPDDSLRSAA